MSNTDKPMTADEMIEKFLHHENGSGFRASVEHYLRSGRPSGSLYVALKQFAQHYAAQQTVDLRKQLAEKEAEIEKLKSLRRFSVDYWHEDGYIESDISEEKDGEWVKWSDVERILSKKEAGNE